MGNVEHHNPATSPRGSKPAPRNVFPVTERTWIEQRLGAGEEGARDVNRHLMSIYYEPLKVYFLGTSWRRRWDPHDVVCGFFVSRLEQPDFAEKWRRSGKPLRKWLMIALNLYLQEKWRREKRDGMMAPLDTDPAQPDGAPAEPGVAREYVRSVALHALREGQRTCEEAGRAAHWEVFFSHEVRGLPYARIVEQLGITRERCVVMDRTARVKFVAALREAVAADLPPGTDVDDEIRRLLEEGGA
jgi:hypothetical protein